MILYMALSEDSYLIQMCWAIIFYLALYTAGDSEIDHLWRGRSGERSMMLKDPKLPNDPED